MNFRIIMSKCVKRVKAEPACDSDVLDMTDMVDVLGVTVPVRRWRMAS